MSIAEPVTKPETTRRTPALSAVESQRTLNVPFLATSLVLFGLMMVAAYGVHRWQVSQTATSLLKRAEQLEAEKKWFEAADYIQHYLRLNPDASQEWIRLARIYDQGANSFNERERSIDLHYRALGTGLKEEQTALRLRLSALLLANQRYLEARTESEELLAGDPENAEALRVRALALWGQWQSGGTTSARPSVEFSIDRSPQSVGDGSNTLDGPTVAQSGTNLVLIALEDAVARNGGDLDVTVALATAYRDQKLKAYLPEDRNKALSDATELSDGYRIKAADALMSRFTVLRTQNAQELLASYRYEQRWGIAGAQANLEEALRIAPDDVNVLLEAADYARIQARQAKALGGTDLEIEQQLELARGRYTRAIELDPKSNNPQPRLSLGDVLAAMKRSTEAVAAWETGLENFKDTPYSVEFHGRLAAHWLEQNDLTQAESSLAAVDVSISKFPPGVARDAVLNIEQEQDLRRGHWHIKRKEHQLAISPLQRVVERQEQLGGKTESGLRALLLLGGAYAAESEWTAAAEAYDRAAVQEPSLAAAHLAASTCWLAANGIEPAVERAERAIRLQPSCKAWYLLATALHRQQLLLPVADRVWSRFDQALAAGQTLANDGTFEEPWRLDLLGVEAMLAQSDTAASSQLQREAVLALQRAEAKFPDVRELWLALPIAYQRLGASREADQSCEQLRTLSSTEDQANLIQARLYQMRGEFEAAEEALVQLAQGSSDQASLQDEMINIKLGRKDYAAARALLVAKHTQFPKDLTTLRRLADIDLESNRLDDAQRWESAMAACGNAGESLSLYFSVRRTLLRVASASDPLLVKVTEDQAKLVRARPNWAEAVALGGTIEQLRGRLEQAISAYERAIALGDQRMAVYERLIGLLEATNRTAEAERYLTRLKSQVPLSQQLTMFESTLELRRNQLEDAIEIARNGVRRRPDDASAHLWLGRMLDRKDLLKEAETEFVEATRLAPSDVRTWNAAFEFYVRTGDKEKARSTLSELAAHAKLSEAERSFVLAQHHEVLGDLDLAAKEYLEAVAQSPKNPVVLLRVANFYRGSDLAKSIELAKSAFQLDPESGVTRRTLAVILADRGRDEDWMTLDQLLGSASQSAELSDDNRFRAILLARRGGAENLRQAVAILNELVDRPGGNKRDRLMLAQLYERQSKFATEPSLAQLSLEKAQQQLELLCDGVNVEPLYLLAYAEFFLRHNQSEAAETPLARLATVLSESAKPTPGLLAEHIRLCLRQGNDKLAEAQLQRLEQLEPNALSCISLRTQLLAKQGESGEIESFVDSAATRLLTNAQRQVEQIAVCQGVGDLYASLKQHAAAERWYRRLYELAPNRFESLVGALTEQGRIGEAIGLCREVSRGKQSLAAGLAAIAVLSTSTPSESEASDAQALIAEVQKQYPGNEQLLAGIATLQVVQGKTEDAIAAYRDLVRRNQRDWTALNNLATLLGEDPKQRDEALQCIEKALKIAGGEASLLDTRGTILFLQGRAEEAIQSLEPAVKESDADPRYRFHLALAYHEVKRTAEAKNELERALQKDLTKQILTANERQLLAQLRTQLSL